MDLHKRCTKVVSILLKEYPEAVTLLEHRNCYELMVAVILSSRTTDAQVNRVTPRLFSRFPGPKELAAANPSVIEDIIHSVGFFRVKTKNIVAAAGVLCSRFSGDLPSNMDDLLLIPGLGRKGANVLLGTCFAKPAIIVDTHFGRVVKRIGLTERDNPAQVEKELRLLVEHSLQTRFSMAVNLHGRRVCFSRNPACNLCVVCGLCSYYNQIFLER
jgi:endonuclease III